MTAALIVAMTKGWVIGRNNDMPWHLPEDLKLFKAKTTGHIIAMGRKTYESIGRPLPNRDNFVISRSDVQIEGCEVFHSPIDCVEAAKNLGKKLFFIGGGQIYSQVIDLVDEMHISYVNEDCKGDTYFPEFDINDWNVVETEEYPDFVYKRLVRK